MFLVSGIGAWLSTVHKLNQHNHDWLNFIIVVIFIFIIVIIIIIIIMPEIKLLSKTFSPACRLRPAGRPLRCGKGQGGFRQGGLWQIAQVSGYQLTRSGGARL